MKDKDKEAFEKWELDYFGQNDNCPHYILHIKNTWYAACEYKDKELMEYKEAAKSETEEINRLQSEIKKLREALEFYADEKNMVSLTGLPFGRRAREALKEVSEK
jgi:predicted metal-binding protein